MEAEIKKQFFAGERDYIGSIEALEGCCGYLPKDAEAIVEKWFEEQCSRFDKK